MTESQNQKLKQFLQIIEESAVQIINDNNLNDKDLLFYMYQKGFEFMQKQTDQNLIDLGSIGLAYAIKRTK